MQLAQHLEAAQPGQEQVEHDEVPRGRSGEREPVAPVVRRVDRVPLGFEAPREKGQDPRFVLDHQDSHRVPISPAAALDCNAGRGT